MPKKAKRGGGGGGRTEEEKLLLLQQRVQAEEEMAKKKEEILTLFLKDKLQKEERNTAVNLLKLNEGWRSILRRTRAAELHHDITVLSQTFERHLDGLDSIIKNLERDLQEAECQSAQVRRLHLQRVEHLWALQEERLLFVQQRWEGDLQQLSCSFSSERQQMQSDSEQQRMDLEDATFTVEQQHQTAMEELCRLYSESIALLQSAHSNRKTSLLQDTKTTEKLLQIKKATEEATDRLDRLLSRNSCVIQVTDRDMKRVKKMQEVVISMREMVNFTKTENQAVVQDLSAARDQVNRKAHELRDQLTQAQTAARKQLTDLTIQSDAAAKKLQAVIAKGEKVFRVAELCCRLESEQRKVSAALICAEEHGPDRTGPEEPAQVSEFPQLQQVTRRINAAVLQQEALKRRRDDLSRENQQLRLLLRQHLDTMTVSDSAFDGHHALLAVYQTPTITGPMDTNRHHTVIEAIHAVKHSM